MAVSDEVPLVPSTSVLSPCDPWDLWASILLALRSAVFIIIVCCLIKTMSNYLASGFEPLDRERDEKRAH